MSSSGPVRSTAERPPVCWQACGHHHAAGDLFDPALISGPPCDGCRWCQAIAARA